MIGMSVPFMLPASATVQAAVELTMAPAPEPVFEAPRRPAPVVSNVPLGRVTIAGLPSAPGYSLNGNVSPEVNLNVMGAVVSLQQKVMAPITEPHVAKRNPYAHYFQQVHAVLNF